ncbi:MAG: hypothetical protein DWQ35_08035 [Planctomycetota bacterium]|nr:MAG: hypothetical protein DWQ35_08035 [Planctomycetota bacterium]
MQKTLDQKLANIHADPHGAKDFILADAKDADMAFGIGAPGKSPESHADEVRFKTLGEYREQIRQIVRQGLVDIMLMSASTNDVLTIGERLFDDSPITPAARANDASDVFVVRGGKYLEAPAQPFRTATLDHIQCGHVDCSAEDRFRGANLGLYSVTFNNRLDDDLRTLEAYRCFRIEAERKGFRHFLEIFNPNMPDGLSPEMIPDFVNDHIARTLAGVAMPGRPVFLKMVYQGPQAMEDLVAYDPHLVVGILGGSSGTTLDAFKLLYEAKKYGARAALFGRKINNSECQLAFVQFLRMLADGEIEPEEAVRAYHGVLQKLGIRPLRSLADDLQLQTAVMSYASGGQVVVPAGVPVGSSESSPQPGRTRVGKKEKKDCGCGCNGAPGGCGDGSKAVVYDPENPPNFAAMTQAEKLAYNKAKRDHIYGD